ncbi:SGNH/GDSL hydrolase family protein [Actinokineospora bangkokensis]|uniref:SGNH hydrolase-type esterase domain-containing protein n=1 Tax=Actinokineospora bangkokensis TaxID=1193682 RepID=A0A1Q9LGD0_9PSEU|nr:SGNH/GDSL hydrolase family protein [Actinokineospora bangkokensis]OLR91098.1 hypothetical protein BJP25_27310 [Actinokineospora bangkokensis]
MRSGVVGLCAALVCAAVPASASVVPGPVFGEYVALGDSYAAGPLVPDAVRDAPAGCARSTGNYPSLLARWLRVGSFTDVTCSGARTADLTGPQVFRSGTNPPQLAAVTSSTDLVTLTIGGNDVGFGEIVATCAREGSKDPAGDLCTRYYARPGSDVLTERVNEVAERVTEVLRTIHRTAPRAKVVLVGYPRILPEGAGCWPRVPFAAGDSAYFDAVERRLNAALARAAADTLTDYVDPYRYGVGRDACADPAVRWVEPIAARNPALALHPNAGGMAAVAALTWVAARR